MSAAGSINIIHQQQQMAERMNGIQRQEQSEITRVRHAVVDALAREALGVQQVAAAVREAGIQQRSLGRVVDTWA